jgi:ParB family chromosome partitioning protein
MEEARGYRSLMEEFNLTQDEAARRVGKSRSVVANALRLLQLPEPVQELVQGKALSGGHARALMGLEDGVAVVPLAQEIAERGLNVRESEKLVKRHNEETKPAPEQAAARKVAEQVLPPEMRPPQLFDEVRLSMSEAMGRRVKIIPKGYDSGQLVIDFYSLEELMEMARALGGA